MSSGGLAEAEAKGRPLGIFAVDATLACVGKPGHWAVGDAAAVPDPKGQGFCPPTAQFAIREAKTCAHNVLAAIDGGKSTPFSFEVLGMLASLGQRRAVAQMFGVTFSGFIAWFMWRSVYLMKLPGMVRRLRVAIDWSLDLFFPRDITQLDADRPRRLDVRHYEAGEVIVQQGTIGRELFMITQGDVEVLGENRGATSKVLARLGKQEVFGERALLEDTPRTATVRAASPVDVLVMSRDDFRSLVAQFQVLDEHFANMLRTRYPDAMGEAPMLDRIESDAMVPHTKGQTVPQPQPSA
jgi:NADH dehydrogenase